VGFAGLPLGLFREQARVLEKHRSRWECLIGSQRGAYTSRLQTRVSLNRVIVHRVVSNDPLIQAERGILMPSLLGCPGLPVEHLGEQWRAWKALFKVLPERGSSVVVALAILQPASLPQAGLGLLVRGKILRQALVEVDRFGQFLLLLLEASQGPEHFGSPGEDRGLHQPHLVYLHAIGRLVLALIHGPEQMIRFRQMRPLGVTT